MPPDDDDEGGEPRDDGPDYNAFVPFAQTTADTEPDDLPF
jgi:hypothetical protein